MTILSKPAAFNLRITRLSSGSPPTLTNAFGILSVSGFRRVPIPAANIIACIMLNFMSTNLVISIESPKFIYLVYSLFLCFEHLFYTLFTMTNNHFDTKFIVKMLGKMLRTIHRSMLATSTSK